MNDLLSLFTLCARCKPPIFVFLNLRLQVFLRKQDNKANYNLISETLALLDCICGSTTGGLGLLGLYIDEHNVSLINQCLCSLTEYCQGPCHESQVCKQELISFNNWVFPECLLYILVFLCSWFFPECLLYRLVFLCSWVFPECLLYINVPL